MRLMSWNCICAVAVTAVWASQANAALINVAVGQPATASTELNSSFLAGNAVDGDTSASTFYHSKTNDFAPFWEVDLGTEYPIEDVAIYNRANGSGDFGTRLNNVLVEVKDASNTQTFLSGLFNPWDGTGTPLNPGPGPHMFDPAGALGRYVRVYKDPAHDGSEWLPLAEVQVFVESSNIPEPSTCALLVLGVAGIAVCRRK